MPYWDVQTLARANPVGGRKRCDVSGVMDMVLTRLGAFLVGKAQLWGSEAIPPNCQQGGGARNAPREGPRYGVNSSVHGRTMGDDAGSRSLDSQSLRTIHMAQAARLARACKRTAWGRAVLTLDGSKIVLIKANKLVSGMSFRSFVVVLNLCP